MATATVTNTLVTATTITAAAHNTNFSDLVTFLNSNVVHVDGSKAMTATLNLANFGFKNVGNFLKAYKVFTDTDWSPSVASTEEDITGASVTITDPAIPVQVFVWAHANVRNPSTSSFSTKMRILVDGVAGNENSVNTGALAGERAGISIGQTYSFDPTGNFIIKAQGYATDTSVVFDHIGVYALILPQ